MSKQQINLSVSISNSSSMFNNNKLCTVKNKNFLEMPSTSLGIVGYSTNLRINNSIDDGDHNLTIGSNVIESPLKNVYCQCHQK